MPDTASNPLFSDNEANNITRIQTNQTTRKNNKRPYIYPLREFKQ